eukprot:scaffold1004_cov269-Pinguiococcus_pyrenoidosus.AAC.15
MHREDVWTREGTGLQREAVGAEASSESRKDANVEARAKFARYAGDGQMKTSRGSGFKSADGGAFKIFPQRLFAHSRVAEVRNHR